MDGLCYDTLEGLSWIHMHVWLLDHNIEVMAGEKVVWGAMISYFEFIHLTIVPLLEPNHFTSTN